MKISQRKRKEKKVNWLDGGVFSWQPTSLLDYRPSLNSTRVLRSPIGDLALTGGARVPVSCSWHRSTLSRPNHYHLGSTVQGSSRAHGLMLFPCLVGHACWAHPLFQRSRLPSPDYFCGDLNGIPMGGIASARLVLLKPGNVTTSSPTDFRHRWVSGGFCRGVLTIKTQSLHHHSQA